MKALLAVDPGLNNPAAALFLGGRLVQASRVKSDPSWKHYNVGERCRLVGENIFHWAINAGLPLSDDTWLSIEWPQVYRASRSKGDPNDLLPLVGVAMCVAGRARLQVLTYTPAEWIGQCPKVTTGDPLASPRGALIWRHLDTNERASATVSHDSLDAIGLGLFTLGRLQRRSYPRG